MEPALTAEEWAAELGCDFPPPLASPRFAADVWDDCHALAALCLYGQPFGFTHDMLANVRLERESGVDADDNPIIRDVAVLDREQWFAIAERIAALIPPIERPDDGNAHG